MKTNFRLRPSMFILALAASGVVALADVADRSDTGFTVKYAVAITTTPAQAFPKIADIANWWDSAHTYSGDARNLSIDMKPGGCFCERLPNGGGVEHMRVVQLCSGAECSHGWRARSVAGQWRRGQSQHRRSEEQSWRDTGAYLSSWRLYSGRSSEYGSAGSTRSSDSNSNASLI